MARTKLAAHQVHSSIGLWNKIDTYSTSDRVIWAGGEWLASGTTTAGQEPGVHNVWIALSINGIIDVPSAATPSIASGVHSQVVRITGTTGISAFESGIPAGVLRKLRFAASLSLTHNGTSFILPGASDIQTAAEDTAEFISLGSNNWLCSSYKRASGQSPNEYASTSVASAATTDIGAAGRENIIITGTTTITSLGSSAEIGTKKFVTFSGALTLTHNATSLILPGSSNITTAANDCAVFRYLGSGNWLCMLYQRASGFGSGGSPWFDDDGTTPGTAPSATGSGSIAIGNNAAASGSSGLAFGASSRASGSNSIAIGVSAVANTVTGTGATVIGNNCSATQGNNSVAVGASASAGSTSVSFGRSTSSSGTAAVSLGISNTAGGTSSVSIGISNVIASASNAIAVGRSCTASSGYATAVGNSATASGYASLAIGKGATASATYATAIGPSSRARIGSTTNIAGLVILAKAPAVTSVLLNNTATEVILASDEVDLKTLATTTLSLPATSAFYVNSISVILSTLGGTITGDPQAMIGSTANGTQYYKSTSVIPITGKSLRDRVEVLGFEFSSVGLKPETSGAPLRIEITTAATGSADIKARFLFKGILVENQ